MIILIKFNIFCGSCGNEKIFEIHYPQGPIPEFMYLDMIDHGQNKMGWKYLVSDDWICKKCLHLSNDDPK